MIDSAFANACAKPAADCVPATPGVPADAVAVLLAGAPIETLPLLPTVMKLPRAYADTAVVISSIQMFGPV
jgi:hypothetical protein